MIPTLTNPLGTDYRQPLTLTALSASSSVTLNATGSPVVSGLKYRTRSGSWQTYTPGTTVPLSAVGDYVQFWNTAGQLSSNTSNYVQFAMTGSIAGSGDVQSLLNFSTQATNNGFVRLFQNCTSLTAAPKLLATSLAASCYSEMFRNCTSLTAAPKLPATSLASYCYYWMFAQCSSLTDASELPATQLYDSCYSGMFRSSGVVSAPELPATTLANNCYNGMFTGCSSLTKAPELPAAALANNCYNGMFLNCRNLTEMNVGFTAWNDSATSDWLYLVSAEGTFIKPADLPEEYGSSRIPTGWTIINK